MALICFRFFKDGYIFARRLVNIICDVNTHILIEVILILFIVWLIINISVTLFFLILLLLYYFPDKFIMVLHKMISFYFVRFYTIIKQSSPIWWMPTFLISITTCFTYFWGLPVVKSWSRNLGVSVW